MITAELEGLGSFLSNAFRVSKLVKATTRTQIADGVSELVAAIRDDAPVDTGGLRDSVRSEPVPNEDAFLIRAGDVPETERPLKSGHMLDQAPLIEYGTVNRPATPFFFPNVERYKPLIENRVDNAVSSLDEEV